MPSRWSSSGLCAVLSLLGAAVSSGADGPFLEKYCVECHGGERPAAGLSLTAVSENLDDPAVAATQVRVFDRVLKREMPPADADSPPDAERAAFLDALRTRLHAASLARQRSEGRVGVRRLNRSEYQHTLHDLLGVTTDVKSILPEDGVVGGFDKAAGGLETSAAHLVRYQQAIDRALGDALPSSMALEAPLTTRWTGRQFLDGRPKPNRAGTEPFVQFEGDTIVLCATLYKHGSVTTAATPVAGRYRIRASVRAVRSQGKPIPVLLGRISCDRFAHERLEHLLDIQDAPPDRAREIQLEATLPAGEQVYLEGLGLIFFGELAKQRENRPVDSTYSGPGLAVDWIELHGPLDAGVGYRTLYGGLPRVPQRYFDDAAAGKPVPDDYTRWHPNEFDKPHNRLRLVSKDPRGDAERLLRAFAPRAFRRPVSEERLAAIVARAHQRLDRGEPLDEALTAVYKELLCSTRFWMPVERPGELDDFALAERLSYFLWDSLPDAELTAAAARGDLTRAGSHELRKQTDRLLDDPKSRRFLESFTGQWLDLRKIHDMKPDAMYVEYDELLAWSMPEETRRFFAELIRHDLPARLVFDSDWAMLNERLARHYGVSGVEGMDFRRTTLPASAERGGVITQASVLKLSTNATYTSPVKRGAWVLERILGTPPSPPPPDVAAIEPDIRGAVTIREQLTKHQASAVCASCHARIDPPGFALERFDVIGGRREFYRAKQGGDGARYVELANYPGRKVWETRPVDCSGTLASGESFDDLNAYRRLVLRDSDQLARNLAEKLLVYSTGAPLQFADREVVERIVEAARPSGHGVRTLIHEVVNSRTFRIR